MDDESLRQAEVEAEALTKMLRQKGKRRTHAEIPAYRISGPLHGTAINLGISFSHLLKSKPKGKKARGLNG